MNLIDEIILEINKYVVPGYSQYYKIRLSSPKLKDYYFYNDFMNRWEVVEWTGMYYHDGYSMSSSYMSWDSFSNLDLNVITIDRIPKTSHKDFYKFKQIWPSNDNK